LDAPTGGHGLLGYPGSVTVWAKAGTAARSTVVSIATTNVGFFMDQKGWFSPPGSMIAGTPPVGVAALHP